METLREITLGSLFDGAGGFPYAGTLTGITPIWASEIEPFPIRITTRRFPRMKHLGNIAEVDGGKIAPVDIITFGSPCQDLSVAGNRAGLEGERSGLFREAIRIIREMREKTNGEKPRYIVWENVPGAFSSNKGEDFRTVLEEIAKTKDGGVSIPRPEKGKWNSAGEIMGDGFSIAWRTYDAQFWGVPQRRKRIYLVCDFGGGNAGKIQFESDRLCGDFTQGGREGQGTAGASESDAGTPGRGPMEPGGICLNDQGGSQMDITEGITGTIRAEMHGNTPIVMTPRHYEAYQHHGWRESETAGTLTAEQNNHVRGDTPIVVEQTQKAEQKVLAFHLTQDPSTAEEKSLCISTGNPRNGQATVGVVVQKPTVYGLSSKGSNAWKSSNPHSGCYEAETTRTLDTRGGDPTCAQGGEIIIQPKVFENHGQDTRFRDTGEVCQTVTQKYGTGGGNTPIVVQNKAYSIGNGQTHSLYLDEKARTLDTMHDAQAVIVPREKPAYGIDRAAFNQGKNALYNFSIEEELQPCLVAKGPGAVAVPQDDDEFPYIARRLMPIECSRLQGYPDWWTAEIREQEPTEEEISWWLGVFETHREATKPDTKPRTRNQIAKWLKDPQTDSAEYRMWGNSLAIPNAYQVLAGIAEQIRNPQEDEPERKLEPQGQLSIWDFMEQ